MILPVVFPLLGKTLCLFKNCLIKLCVGLRTDFNKDSTHPNLNLNQKAAQLQASCGFGTSKLPCSTPMTTTTWLSHT